MSTHIALLQPTDRRFSKSNSATQAIKDGTAVAQKLGINIRHLYWTRGVFAAVLVLQDADEAGIMQWKNSLKNLRAKVIPAALASDRDPQTGSQGWNTSCDDIHWWY